MGHRRTGFAWPGLALTTLLAAAPLAARAAPADTDLPPPTSLTFEAVAPHLRDRVRFVVEQTTLSANAPAETFVCSPALYNWLLDRPDQTARLWRLVGARCTDIRGLGPASFAWEDGQGSRMSWEVAERSPRRHVWYAEGEVKAGAWLPRVSVRAVLVADHVEGTDGQGHAVVRHRLTLFAHADSRAVAAAARVVGASAPRLAEQYLGQVESFFGAMAWYLENHPEHARLLMEQLRRPAETDPPQLPPARAGAAGGAE